MRRAKHGLLALGGLLLVLMMAEVLCRCFDVFVPPMLLAKDDAPVTEKPYSRRRQAHFAAENRSWANQGVPLRELGYRTSHTLATGTNGVVLLGDSFTAAREAPEGASYAELLQQVLAPTPVVNMGVGGSGLDNMNYQLRSFVDALRPRLVVCSVYAADLWRHEPDWLQMRNRPVARLEGGRINYVSACQALRHPFLYYHSRVYQMDNYLLRKSREQWASNFLTLGSLYRLNEALLGDMKSACDRHHARLMVMFIPSRTSLENGALVLKWTRPRALRRICSLYDIPLLDLTPRLQAKPSAYYKPGDVHFTEEGHRLAFVRLREFIAEHRLLEAPAE
ncbi:MAG: SGNH/GDSL hydrolase family protein [Verrucomicrobiae bacterium]|nr:SGNH/GDSL hydrolase family protein [Verrucomicrobiae bacterium]